jgi:hypothetical protein
MFSLNIGQWGYYRVAPPRLEGGTREALGGESADHRLLNSTGPLSTVGQSPYGLNRDPYAEDEYHHGAHRWDVSAHRGHSGRVLEQLTALEKQQPDPGQHPAQPQAESDQQQQSKPRALQGYGGEQENQCRRTRQQSAGDPQAQQRAPCHRRAIRSWWQVGVAMAVSAMCAVMAMVAVLMTMIVMLIVMLVGMTALVRLFVRHVATEQWPEPCRRH